jgi:hypothetical protein
MALSKYTPPNEKKTIEILSLPYTEIENIKDIKYNWVMIGSFVTLSSNCETASPKPTEKSSYGFPKYGRSVYCLNTGIRRNQTINEFYNS